MKLPELLMVITLTVTLVGADNLPLTTSKLTVLDRKTSVAEKGILLPTLLIAGTLSLCITSCKQQQQQQKLQPLSISKNDRSRPQVKRKRKGFITSAENVELEMKKENLKDEEEIWNYPVILKLAKSVQWDETNLRSLEGIVYSHDDDDNDEDYNPEQHDQKEASIEWKSAETMLSSSSHDPPHSLANSCDSNADQDDGYERLNQKILNLVSQARRALKRPSAEYDQFDIIDDVGTDLDFLSFMGGVSEEIKQLSIQKDNFQRVTIPFLVTGFFYLMRMCLILWIFTSMPGTITSVKTYAYMLLMCIVHIGTLRILDVFRVPIL